MRQFKTKKFSLAIYTILLFAAITLMFAIRQCDNSHLSTFTQIGNSKGDTIDVAISYTPMNYYIYADTLGGFNYDLLKIYSQQTGRPLKFHPIVSLDDALLKLDTGNFDMIVSLPVDNKLRKKYLYTNDVFKDRQVLIQKLNDNGSIDVTSSLDLAGDTLHIEKDSPVAFRIQNLSHEIGDTIFIEEHAELSSELLFLKIAAGDYKYAVVNEKIARPLLEIHKNVSIDTPISFTQFQAWLLRKSDSNLQNQLNLWIDSIKNTQTYIDLLKKYQ